MSKLFLQYSLSILIVVKLNLVMIKTYLKAETKQNFPKSKNHLVQKSRFLYNNPIKNAKNKSAKGTPLQVLRLQL